MIAKKLHKSAFFPLTFIFHVLYCIRESPYSKVIGNVLQVCPSKIRESFLTENKRVSERGSLSLFYYLPQPSPKLLKSNRQLLVDSLSF
jgi:hypothetical protein